jgi:tetratricopeptide (TPR) repeat protein
MNAVKDKTMTFGGRGLRILILAGIVSVSAACAPIGDQEFWNQATSFAGKDDTALGLSELVSGNYPAAEKFLDAAIERNPLNGYALLWRGLVYQNTGRPEKARQDYSAVIAANPPGTIVMAGPNTTQLHPLRDAAQYNLGRLEQGQPGVVGVSPDAMKMAAASTNGAAMMAGPFDNATAQPQPANATRADANIARRFAILRNLQTAGLITPEEYSARRAANLGALLPMTAPAPAAYLDREPPDGREIQSRLEQLNKSLQMGAVTVQDHVNERTAILDGLLPADPRERATPAPAPQGLMDAARKISRIEDLQKEKLITSTEFTKERNAIEASIIEPANASMVAQEGQPVRRVATGADAPSRPVNKVATAPAKSSAGAEIHLASYRNQTQAERGWLILGSRFANELGGLDHEIRKVTVPGKGTFYRLLADGMDPRKAAQVCADLKKRGQFCDVK